MQFVLHVKAKSSLRESLREQIIDKVNTGRTNLVVESEKKLGRKGGWAKIKADNIAGVINIYWHANSKTLIVRAVARMDNTPGELVGIFIAYLLEYHRKQISCISIIPA